MPHRRVVVFGYGPLAVTSLQTLAALGITPVALVVPGNRTGKDVDLAASYAKSAGIPVVVQPARARITPFIAEIERLNPELFFVWSYSMMLPPELIALAPLGAVNLHGGLLPEYRGGHVMNWAIANGETETGATLAYLDDGIDTGPVIAERRFPIEWHDDAGRVRDKLKLAGRALLEQWWPAIEQGTAPRTAQDESRARYYRMRTAADGLIDWSKSNREIYNLVRALTPPWPGAFATIDGQRLVFHRAEPVSTSSAVAPGTVVSNRRGDLRIATGDGDLRLLDDHLLHSALAVGVRLNS